MFISIWLALSRRLYCRLFWASALSFTARIVAGRASWPALPSLFLSSDEKSSTTCCLSMAESILEFSLGLLGVKSSTIYFGFWVESKFWEPTTNYCSGVSTLEFSAGFFLSELPKLEELTSRLFWSLSATIYDIAAGKLASCLPGWGTTFVEGINELTSFSFFVPTTPYLEGAVRTGETTTLPFTTHEGVGAFNSLLLDL